tara:strand:+ start:709 stop:1470 length:762 start_codon:yes stop_codon:yes gene_type:complete
MKIFFHHILGKMTQYDLAYYNAYAYVEPEEEDYALKHGWAIDEYVKEPVTWIQGRQTRLKSSPQPKYSKSWRKYINRCKCIETQIKPFKDCDLDEMWRVFLRYSDHREFDITHANHYKEELFPQNKIVFQYREDGVLHGFLIARLYDNSNSMTSLQFCWDYHKNNLNLGKFSVVKELEYAQENDIDYIYMQEGYEKQCIYKSDLPNFEFWDGEDWKDDVDTYKIMCENDSSTESLKDLSELMWDYEKNYFKMV